MHDQHCKHKLRILQNYTIYSFRKILLLFLSDLHTMLHPLTYDIGHFGTASIFISHRLTKILMFEILEIVAGLAAIQAHVWFEIEIIIIQ